MFKISEKIRLKVDVGFLKQKKSCKSSITGLIFRNDKL